MRSQLILKSKIIRPKLGKDIIYRPKVQEKLKLAGEYPLTLVSASAGFGKTTCITQLLSSLNLPYSWYSPGPEDDSIYIFSHYLAAALESVVPGIKEWYFTNVTSKKQFNWKRAFEVLLAGIEDLDTNDNICMLVIDDWHLLQKEPDIKEFMNRFLLCRPANLHVIMLSREKFFLPAINNFKAESKVLEIENEDLAFSFEEVQQLMDLLAPNKFSFGEINKIFEYTEGWIMAIKLILNSQQRTSLLPKKDFRILFEYLAHDILNKQKQELQELLLITSIPEYISLTMTQKLAGNLIEYFDDLISSGLFLNEVGKEQYCYHHMFRDFLYREAEKRLPNFLELHNKVATFYLQKGEKESALNYFIKGQNWIDAEKLFVCMARELVASGREIAFNNYLQLLPEQFCHNPEIYLAQGDLARNISDYRQALIDYQKAADAYESEDNDGGISKAYQGMGEVFLDKIEPSQAQVFLRLAYKKLIKNQGREKASILGLMAENMVNQGKPRQAERYLNLANSRFYFEDVHNLEARVMTRTGRLNEAIKYLEKQNKVDKKLKKVHFSYRETPLLLSFCYSLFGQAEKALAAANEGIKIGESMKSPFVTSVGYFRLGHALLISEGNNKSEAWEAYSKALESVNKLNIIRVKTEVNVGICLIHALNKDWKQARCCGLEGVKITEDVKDQWFSAILIHTLGMAGAICGYYEESKKYLVKAEKAFEKCGDSFGKTFVYWWYAFVAYKTGNTNEFTITFGKLLDMSNSYGYEFLLERASLFGDVTGTYSAELVGEAKKLGLLHRYSTISPSDKSLENSDQFLRIRTFGGLKIIRGEKEGPVKEWRRESSLRLFCLFITKRKFLLNKETLMFDLWPDVDNAFAVRNFKSALNNLMNILEPDRRPWAPCHFIQRKGATYYFNLAANFWLDVNEFERSIDTALKIYHNEPQRAEDLLVYALSLYEGDYLVDINQDEWCLEERDRLAILYINAAVTLAKLKLHKGEYEEALKFSGYVLERDSCWEAAYQIMMRCYSKMNNQVMVVRSYNHCREVLMQELGIEPSTETELVYKKCCTLK